MGKPFIFFSYKRADPAHADRIEKIFARLVALKFELFRDRHPNSYEKERTIQPGSSWINQLDQSLRECACGIVLWSFASRCSDYVQSEAVSLRRLNKYVPIELDRNCIPGPLAAIDAVSLCDWSGDETDPEWQRLIHLLSQRLQAPELFLVDRSTEFTRMVPKAPFDVALSDVELRTEHLYFRDAPDLPLMQKISAKSAISIDLVTKAEWHCAGKSGARGVDAAIPDEAPSNEPVRGVSWDEAMSYAAWLNVRVDRAIYRLPTEAEHAILEAPASSAAPNANSNPNHRYYLMRPLLWEWTSDTYSEAMQHNTSAQPYLGGGLSMYRVALRRTGHESATFNLERSGFGRAFKRADIGFRIARDLL